VLGAETGVALLYFSGQVVVAKRMS
jgi:hypothetical protein